MFFIFFCLGWPLGRLWDLGPPPGDLFWVSLVASLVLEALWGPFWVHLCPFWSAFTSFRHPMGSYFLNFKHNSDLTEMYNQIHICVFHFTFYVAVCPY